MINKNSIEWQSLKQIMLGSISSQQDVLESCSSPDRMFRAQGKIQALRQLIQDVEDPAPTPPTPE